MRIKTKTHAGKKQKCQTTRNNDEKQEKKNHNNHNDEVA
jgi:hypothetical protein